MGSAGVNNALQLFTLLIHLVVICRIKVYKWKTRLSEKSAHPKSKLFWLVGLEKHNMTDLTTNVISVIFFGVSQIQIIYVELDDLNHFPHYLSEYIYRLIRVPLMIHLLVAVFYIRHKELRVTVKRELENLFGGQDLANFR